MVDALSLLFFTRESWRVERHGHIRKTSGTDGVASMLAKSGFGEIWVKTDPVEFSCPVVAHRRARGPRWSAANVEPGSWRLWKGPVLEGDVPLSATGTA